VQDFLAIGETGAQIWRFFDLSKWRPSAMLFLEIRNFIGR